MRKYTEKDVAIVKVLGSSDLATADKFGPTELGLACGQPYCSASSYVTGCL